MVTGTQVQKSQIDRAQVAPTHLIEMPNFHTDLRSMEVFDGQNVHLETKLTPVNDPKLSIVWLHNGKPIVASEFLRSLCFECYGESIRMKLRYLIFVSHNRTEYNILDRKYFSNRGYFVA